MKAVTPPTSDTRAVSPPPHPAQGTQNSPTISVIIPVYNGASYVARAVASVLQQDCPVRELLLIDDGSTDATPERLRQLASTNPSIRLHSNGKNLGLSATLNLGLRLAVGELVLILHQDCSLVGKDWIARAVRHFEDPAVFSTVGRLSHRVDEMSRKERELWIIRDHTMDEGEDSRGGFRRTLFSENKCDMFRRKPLLDLGGFDSRLTQGGEDQVLAWRLRQTPLAIARDPDLSFEISLGEDQGVWRHLRRDAAYGMQMRQILGVTRFGALARAPGARIDPRFVNRASGVVWMLLALTGLVLLVWTRMPWPLLLLALPPLARWIQLTARGVFQRGPYQLRIGSLLTIGALGLLVDMAYAIGFLLPARRPADADGETLPA
jgi:hypothetical protein